MKKILFAVLSLFLVVCSANAQVNNEIQQSKQRAENLQKLCKKYKACGISEVDNYGNAIVKAAMASMANSELLENMYKRQIGETKDGVKDVTITKPTLEEWVQFAVTVGLEAKELATATSMLSAAADKVKEETEAVKSISNPLKAAKAAKSLAKATAAMTFSADATKILGEESVAKVKAVKTIIDTIKSGKNL